MKPCTRLGLNVGTACNWRCIFCFYRHNPEFHAGPDPPLDGLKAKVDYAKKQGLDHVVLIGFGEPTLSLNTVPLLEYCREQGMATSIITNAAGGINSLKECSYAGVDHYHISSHAATGAVSRAITGSHEGHEVQLEVKDWLGHHGIPFRTNTTMQLRNYLQLTDIAQENIDLGVHHVVFLNFLPHYQWNEPEKCRQIAVHPTKLRPHLEKAAQWCLDTETLFTIRYFPLCHLSPHLWPYVTNARFVPWDPWEWNDALEVRNTEALWRFSVQLGEATACEEPCDNCLAYPWCGGWNRYYAAAFGGAGLKPVRDLPVEYRKVDCRGGLHDLNPANHETGTIRPVSD